MNALRDGGVTRLMAARQLRVGDRVKVFGHFWHLTSIREALIGVVLELAEPGMGMEGLRWTLPPEAAVQTLRAAPQGAPERAT